MPASGREDRRMNNCLMAAADIIGCGQKDLAVWPETAAGKHIFLPATALSDGFAQATEEALSALAPGKTLLVSVNNCLGLQALLGYSFGGNAPFAAPALDGRGSFCDRRTLDEFTDRLNRRGYETRLFYPFPNAACVTALYTDEKLPDERELKTKYSWVREPYHIFAFDDYAVCDSFVRNGLFPQVSSSYFLKITKKEDAHTSERLVYAKYSLTRREDLSIKTLIYADREGRRRVVKEAAFADSERQLSRIEKAYASLTGTFAGIPVSVNRLTRQGKSLVFDYLEGRPLSEKVGALAAAGDEEGLEKTLTAYREAVEKAYAKRVPFAAEGDYRAVFGDVEPAGMEAVRGLDMDLLFENILLTEDGRPHIIDYEWTFDFLLPLKYLYYRAVFFFTVERADALAGDGLRQKLMAFFNISRHEQEIFSEMENAFQASLISDETGLPFPDDDHNVHLQKLLSGEERLDRVQVFFDKGGGFTEADSVFLFRRNTGGPTGFDIELPQGTRAVRIDPGEDPVILSVRKAVFTAGSGGQTDAEFAVNGEAVGDWNLCPPDPQIVLQTDGDKARLHIEIESNVLRSEHGAELMQALCGLKRKENKGGLAPFFSGRKKKHE